MAKYNWTAIDQVVDEMSIRRRKHLAFAECLRITAKANGTLAAAETYIKQAEQGRYASGGVRPAFVFDHFGITEEQWDAMWALVYG